MELYQAQCSNVATILWVHQNVKKRKKSIVASVAKKISTKETITKKTPIQEQFLEDLLFNITKG
jgi:hypothetical protein